MRLSPTQTNKDIVRLIAEAASCPRVAGDFTHGLYRYPAALSPYLSRVLIELFTCKGDLILDPFCGGGTTAIESVALGRRCISSDINSLAVFATRAKATPLSKSDIEEFSRWSSKYESYSEIGKLIRPRPIFTSAGREIAPMSNGLLHFLMATTCEILSPRARRFARLAVLRTGQICFDSNRRKVNPYIVWRTFFNVSENFTRGAKNLFYSYRQNRVNMSNKRLLRVFRSSAERVGDRIQEDAKNVMLVLTSPPYPGMHVLYHRWQYKGRKEINTPYELLDLNDGEFESFYTMGSRNDTGNSKYFESSKEIFTHLNQMLPRNTPVVLILAFPNPAYQLSKYSEVLAASGLEPLWESPCFPVTISREIPNRKWYIRTSSVVSKVRETVFFMKTTER